MHFSNTYEPIYGNYDIAIQPKAPVGNSDDERVMALPCHIAHNIQVVSLFLFAGRSVACYSNSKCMVVCAANFVAHIDTSYIRFGSPTFCLADY